MQASTEYLLLDNWITEYKYLQNTYYRVSRLLNPNTWTILQKLVGYKKNSEMDLRITESIQCKKGEY